MRMMSRVIAAGALALAMPAMAAQTALDQAVARWERMRAANDPASGTIDAIRPLLPSDGTRIAPRLALRIAAAAWAGNDKFLARAYDDRAFDTASKSDPALLIDIAEQRLDHLLFDARFEAVLTEVARTRPRYRTAGIRGDHAARLDWYAAEALRETGDVAGARARLDQGDRLAMDGPGGWESRVRLAMSRADLLTLERRPGAADLLLATIAAVSQGAPDAQRTGYTARLFGRLGIVYADQGNAVSAGQALDTAKRLTATLGPALSVEEALSAINVTACAFGMIVNDVDSVSRKDRQSGIGDFQRDFVPYLDSLGRAGRYTALSYRTRRFVMLMNDAVSGASFLAEDAATARSTFTQVVMAAVASGDRDPELRVRAVRTQAMLDMKDGAGLVKMRTLLADRRRKGLGGDPSTISLLTDLGALQLAMQDTDAAVVTLREAVEQLSARQARAGRNAGNGGGGFGGVSWIIHLLRGGRGNPLDVAYPLFLEALSRADAEQHDAAADEEAFRALQFAAQTDLSATMASIAARSGVADPGLATLLRERSDLELSIAADEQLLLRKLAYRAGDAQAFATALAAKRRELARLDATLAARNPGYVDLAVERPVDLATLRRTLRDDEALVIVIGGRDIPQQPGMIQGSTGTLGDGVYIAAVSRTGFVWRRAAMDASRVSRTVRGLRCQLDAASCGDVPARPGAFDLQAAHDLYRALLAPLEPVTAGKANLLVVATGSLSALPFTVLTTKPPPIGGRDDDPRRLARAAWLIRDRAVSILPSVASLVTIRNEPAPSGERIAFAGFGDPDLSALPPGAPKLAPLPWSHVELTRLRDATGSPAGLTFTGARSTERAAKDTRLQNVRLLMFATHGLSAGSWPDTPEPGLVLTTPLHASAIDDGFLSASEVSELRLDADWVILSACRTAGSDGRPDGDTLSGLARAFFHAGARGILAANWDVRDDVATTLTSDTVLREWSDGTLGRAQALRTSMLAIIGDRDDPSRAHPSVWAPFVLVGESGSYRPEDERRTTAGTGGR